MKTLDLETTGKDTNARIIDIAITPGPHRWRVRPPMPIPPEATAIHGITDADVADCLTFAEVAREVAAVVESADILVGFNIIRYDCPVLSAEFDRCGMRCVFPPLLDVGVLDKIARPRTLSAAVEHWLSRKHMGAHGAVSDCEATEQVLEAMRLWHPEWRDKSLSDLGDLSRYGIRAADPAGKLKWVGDTLCYAFGKNLGVLVTEDPGYAAWVFRSDFPLTTVRMIREALNGS